jgi:Zn-finger nucleic acid-binding protein
VEIYMLLGALVVVLIFVLSFHRHRHDPVPRRRAAPSYTIGAVGGEAGIFWSGAMRCPKCRSDMEPVNHEGTEVDRCGACHGIWFDAGEVEALASTPAALSIDIGAAREGKRLNAVDDYPCPRCGGVMARVVDEAQRHIWYETCGSCSGSFFDAGEFRDLAQVTIGDFFKRLVTPARK